MGESDFKIAVVEDDNGNASHQKYVERLCLREKELDERERMLDDERERVLTFERPPLGDSSDVLCLNVMGTKMQILRRTLTSVEGSLLAAQFSGRWDESLPKDNEGNFFINQPYELWKPMIDYLLDKECETPLSLVVASPPAFAGDNSESMTDRFYRMVEYYQMTSSLYPNHVCYIDKLGDIGEVVASSMSYNSVHSPEKFATFTLTQERCGHERRIKSYEIILENFDYASVGWASYKARGHFCHKKEGQGVGFVKNSIGLDSSKLSVVYKRPDSHYTKAFHIPVQSIYQGSVIRCEEFGRKWYVDGSLVAYTAGVAYDKRAKRIDNWTPCLLIATPFISIRGSFRVSKVELTY